MREDSIQRGKLFRRGAQALAVLAFAAAMPAVTAAPAEAAVCSTSWSNKSDYKAGVYGTGVNYRSGPYTSCDPNGQWSNIQVYYHCWRYGTSVNGENIWWHVRREGTQQQGWVLSSYLGIWSDDPADQC
ncbi:hypothetical protein [Streptomyces sp. SID12488]|uniref:hypothetical protein n=1 Tax=Streptomyces sp. SID12488 TaxID=2706040 RepID=UPI0013DBBA56|nr:hypothetical protein [Streptomyces sp. SID12488]NEA67039.1 hypothetical protein [Streptomyces sp. SID12488]